MIVITLLWVQVGRLKKIRDLVGNRNRLLTGTGAIKRQIPLLIPKREMNKYYK